MAVRCLEKNVVLVLGEVVMIAIAIDAGGDTQLSEDGQRHARRVSGIYVFMMMEQSASFVRW